MRTLAWPPLAPDRSARAHTQMDGHCTLFAYEANTRVAGMNEYER